MKSKYILLLFIAFVFSQISLQAQEHEIRFGFVGNSITIGSGLSNPKSECYPSQIHELLKAKFGDTCTVENYAVSGRTMLKQGDYPIWNEASFKNGVQQAPEIVFILMGTNDSKPQNWDAYHAEFIVDYLAMIDTFKLRNPNTKFVVCYPPPAFGVVWGIRDSVIYNGVIPAVDSILKLRDAILVDFYTPLIDSVILFPDLIHPNARGAKVMAQIAFNRIIESNIVHNAVPDGTFITGFNSDSPEISIKDSITLTWTTRNATKVSINNIEVSANGSKKFNPQSNTDYVLKATGKINTDVFTIHQSVYKPELSKLSVMPNRITIRDNQTLDLKVTYYDQYLHLMKDTLFDVIWSISSGEGTLLNETDTTVTYKPKGVGKAKVQAQVGEITFNTSIVIEAATEIGETNSIQLSTFPNPCNNTLWVQFKPSLSPSAVIRIYDILGTLKMSKTLTETESKNGLYPINVMDLKSGIYIIKIDINDTQVAGRISKI